MARSYRLAISLQWTPVPVRRVSVVVLGNYGDLFAVIGMLFTAAGVRTTLAVPRLRQRRPQPSLAVIPLTTFGLELLSGIELIANPPPELGGRSDRRRAHRRSANRDCPSMGAGR